MLCTIIVPCPAEGQSFSSNCRQINATCSNPSTPALCDSPMCACPLGQVVDEETNKCVNISECSKCILLFSYTIFVTFLCYMMLCTLAWLTMRYNVCTIIYHQV